MSDECEMKEKPDASINLLLLKKHRWDSQANVATLQIKRNQRHISLDKNVLRKNMELRFNLIASH